MSLPVLTETKDEIRERQRTFISSSDLSFAAQNSKPHTMLWAMFSSNTHKEMFSEVHSFLCSWFGFLDYYYYDDALLRC